MQRFHITIKNRVSLWISTILIPLIQTTALFDQWLMIHSLSLSIIISSLIQQWLDQNPSSSIEVLDIVQQTESDSYWAIQYWAVKQIVHLFCVIVLIDQQS